jgi:hypothetical protein
MSEEPKSKKKKVSVDKDQLAEKAEDMEVAAMATGIEGAVDMVEGAEELDIAAG